MSLALDFTLDSDTGEVLSRLIGQLPDAAVIEYAQSTPAFASGGFRRNHAPSIRKRIEQYVLGAEVIDEPLRRLLARYSLNASVIAPLSTSFINDHAAALSDLFGPAQMRLARLLDDRVAVREREVVRPPPSVQAVEAADDPEHRARGVRILREQLATLLDTVGAGAASGDGSAAPSSRGAGAGEARARLEQQLREARKELRRLKGIEERAVRLQKTFETCQTDLKHAQSAQNTAETAARQSRQAVERLEAELRSCREEGEIRVRRLVDAQLAEEFCGWLGGPRATAIRAAAAALSAPGAGDPLLAQAEAALEAQAQADRVSGTRAALQARLGQLETILARCTEALGNAVHPQTALVAAAEALRGEIDRLRRVLEVEAPDALRPLLAAAVNYATADTFGAWRGVIGQLRTTGALGAEEAGALLEGIRRRQAALAQAAEPAPEVRDEEIETPRGCLRAVMLGQLPGILLLDGHNVLFGLQSRYRRPQDHVYPGRPARDCLVGDMVRLAANRPNCRVRVVFDGPARSDTSASANVTTIYSGGEGEHRADKVIVEEVRFFRKESEESMVLLVTNDNELAGEARRLGARTLSPMDLVPFLG